VLIEGLTEAADHITAVGDGRGRALEGTRAGVGEAEAHVGKAGHIGRGLGVGEGGSGQRRIISGDEVPGRGVGEIDRPEGGGSRGLKDENPGGHDVLAAPGGAGPRTDSRQERRPPG
jgi:hypothetical protein